MNTHKSLKNILIMLTGIILATGTLRAAPHHARDQHKHKAARAIHGQRTSVNHLDKTAVRLRLAGTNYFYQAGIFYRTNGKGYIVVTAPVGAKVRNLPKAGHWVVAKNVPYFLFRGSYYRWLVAEQVYQVVAAPHDVITTQSITVAADVVNVLPDGAISIIINGIQYFKKNDQHFLPAIQNGRQVFVAVKF